MTAYPQSHRIGLGILIALALAVSPAGGPAAEDVAGAVWPVFRGNGRQTGAADVALPDKLEPLWKFETKDSIEGAAVVAGGVVYVGSMDENLYALDLATGKKKWQYNAGP